jgi:sarcosine oxidase/L-pipecolate oxidase
MLIECTQNAIHTWRHSPLFSPHYHHTGYLVASSASAPKKATSHISRLIESISSHPDQPKASLAPISSAADVRQCVPQLTGPLNGWSGYFNSHAGYARAAPALQAVYAELINRGVVFRLGAAGQAVAVFPDEDDVKIYPAPRPYVKTYSTRTTRRWRATNREVMGGRPRPLNRRRGCTVQEPTCGQLPGSGLLLRACRN